jgi:hypothetical protein
MLREIIQFLAQIPTDTKIFLTMAVLGLAGMLIVLKWLIQPFIYGAVLGHEGLTPFPSSSVLWFGTMIW